MTAGLPQDPHARRAKPGVPWLLLLGLAAGPADWIAQLLLGYGLSSYACFPRDEPLTTSPPPGWGGEHLWLVVINLVALALTLAALAFAWRRWRDIRGAGSGDAPERLHASRSRFLAHCATLACALFAAAIVFNTVNIVATPACWDIRP